MRTQYSTRALLFLLLALQAFAVSFQRVEIDATPPPNPWIKAVGDIDGDGRPDIVIGGSKGPLVWYRAPAWSKHAISEGGYDSVIVPTTSKPAISTATEKWTSPCAARPASDTRKAIEL
jgi:hypothetical protein